MTGGFRWLPLVLFFILACAVHGFAQETAPAQVNPASVPNVTEDATRMLELGQLLMGQNNPNYTIRPTELPMEKRNEAGKQALRTFRQLTTLYPKYAEGWLWLGIALTETLHYSKQFPKGETERNPKDVAEAVRAYRTAYECKPSDLICATYYGDALIDLCEDFDGARTFWDKYLLTAKTDYQRVTALTQAARACLNKGYFGKEKKKLSPAQIKEQFLAAEQYVQQAVKILPRASSVKAMQDLLEEHRTALCGSK